MSNLKLKFIHLWVERKEAPADKHVKLQIINHSKRFQEHMIREDPKHCAGTIHQKPAQILGLLQCALPNQMERSWNYLRIGYISTSDRTMLGTHRTTCHLPQRCGLR